jgi:hypothetical protein
LSYAASEHFTSKFAQRERAAIPEPALSCLCRRKHSRFLGLAKKCASGSTRADDANTGWWVAALNSQERAFGLDFELSQQPLRFPLAIAPNHLLRYLLLAIKLVAFGKVAFIQFNK